MIVIALFLGIGGLVFPTYARFRRDAAVRAVCHLNLRLIGLALQNYHSQYESFPPAYVSSPARKRLHSWRVLILPFLDENALYRQLRLDEPWDSPHNSQYHDQMPNVFQCREARRLAGDRRTASQTSYVAVVGPKTAWPGRKSRDFAEMTDGMSNTLLVVEVKSPGFHWMEPRDLETYSMSFQINAPAGKCWSSYHEQRDWPWSKKRACVHGLLADGTVHAWDENLTDAAMRALLTVSGGDQADLP